MSRRSLFPFKTAVVVGFCCFLVIEKPPGGKLVVRLPRDSSELADYKTEFYPLSAFPMYSTFAEEVFFAYVTDQDNNPVALNQIPYAVSSLITGGYNSYRDELKKKHKIKGKDANVPLEYKQQAARRVLQNLMLNKCRGWFSQRPDQVFALHEGIISVENGKTKIRETRLTEASFAQLAQEEVSPTTEAPK